MPDTPARPPTTYAELVSASRTAAAIPPQNGQRGPLGVTGQNPAYVQAAVEAELEAVKTEPKGNRNNRLNVAAYNIGQLVGGGELTEADAYQALVDAARSAGLPDADIHKTVNSGLVAGAKQPRSAPPPKPEASGFTPPAVVVLEGETSERTSWWPQPIAERAAEYVETPAPNQLRRDDGQCLFYSAKVNGIIGESESGKSWVALLAIIQAIKRGEHVLLLDFEDSASSMYRRLQLLGMSPDIEPLVHYADPDESLEVLQRGDLNEALAIGYSIIVVDGVNAAMTLLHYDLNSNTDATLFATSLMRPLARTGACVIMIDHVPKNPDGRSKGGIGAQAKRAMITGCQLAAEVLEPFGQGQDGTIRLTVDKDRNGVVRGISASGKYAGKAVIQSSAESVAIKIAAPDLHKREDSEVKSEWAPTQIMEKISILLEGLAEPISFRHIKQATTGTDEYLRKAIDVLRQRGHIDVQNGPRGSLLHSSLKPYRVADSDRVGSVSVSVSRHGEENVSSVSPSPTPPEEGGTHRHGHGSEDSNNAASVSANTVSDTLELELPEGYQHCNQCGNPASDAEIELGDGYCVNCRGRD